MYNGNVDMQTLGILKQKLILETFLPSENFRAKKNGGRECEKNCIQLKWKQRDSVAMLYEETQPVAKAWREEN